MFQSWLNKLTRWDEKFINLLIIEALYQAFRVTMPILILSVYWHLFVQLFLIPNSLFPTILGYANPRILSPQILQATNSLADFAVALILVIAFTRAYLSLRGVEDDLLPILVNFSLTVLNIGAGNQVQNQLYIQYAVILLIALVVSESYYWLDRITSYRIPPFGLTHIIWAVLVGLAMVYIQNLYNSSWLQGPFADFFSDSIFTHFWGLMGVALLAPLSAWLGWKIPIELTQIPMDLNPVTSNIDAVYQSVNATIPYPENLYSVFATFGFLGGVGSTLALSFWLLFTKHKTGRRLGQLAFIPSLFDNNQLLMFGVPVYLRPLMLVPLVLASVSSSLVGFIAIKLKLVDPAIFTVPTGTPRLITGLLASQSHWTSLLLILVIFALTLAIYRPFVLALGKEVTHEAQ
ncbi:PTS sugar transporter subunit IIC [Lactobacillaceae bacterium L1_55_11]|nr:PTS sugar transporter subunit IIC [Lactobacillaceae bacterium L1_55_11]